MRTLQTCTTARPAWLGNAHPALDLFTKPGEGYLSVPKVGGQHVKGFYLDQICKRLGSDD